MTILEIDELIELYLTSKYVEKFELVLEKLVSLTTTRNYNYIISKIDNEPNSTELDLSLYINEISNPKYSDLEGFINSKLSLFKNLDAIEELQEAIIKLAKPNGT